MSWRMTIACPRRCGEAEGHWLQGDQSVRGRRSPGLDYGPPEIRLLFTDIVMPGGMAGDELAKQVRALRPESKSSSRRRCGEPTVAGRELANVGSWLKKPYTAKELAARIRGLLD